MLFRIEDIERHQKTQDLRFFNAFESSQNNSADISELKVGEKKEREEICHVRAAERNGRWESVT